MKILQIYPEYRPQNWQHTEVPATSNEDENIFNKVKNDVDEFDSAVKKHSVGYQAGLYALSPIPTARRVGSLPDSVKEDNWARTGLLVGLAAANLPRDWEEVKFAFKEAKGGVKNIFGNPLNPYQRPQNLFKGTFLERLLPEKFINWAGKADRTLDGTGFGRFVKNIFKIDNVKTKFIDGVGSTEFSTVSAYAYKGSRLQKLVGRSLGRMTVVGVALTSLLELPAIVKSAQKGDTIQEKGKSLGKQLLKSAGYVGLTTAGIMLGGAAGAMIGGTLISLAGMGVGSSFALMAHKQVTKFLDKIIG